MATDHMSGEDHNSWCLEMDGQLVNGARYDYEGTLGSAFKLINKNK